MLGLWSETPSGGIWLCKRRPYAAEVASVALGPSVTTISQTAAPVCMQIASVMVTPSFMAASIPRTIPFAKKHSLREDE